MIDKLFIDDILLQVNNELEHQEKFLKNMKNINNELDNKGSKPLYSIQGLVKSGEQYIQGIKKTIAQLPLEEELD